MKKTGLLLTFFILLFFNYGLKAQSINQEEAKRYAANFISQLSGQKDPSTINLSLVTTNSKSINPEIYVFNESGGGFVIVSGDKKATPILAYSTDDNIPEYNTWESSFAEWIDLYIQQIQILRENNISPAKSVSEKWTLLDNNQNIKTKSQKDVSPLLSTTWNQGCGYNSLCPADAGGPCGHVYTGCVATAMAQVLRYMEYPTQGTGSQCYTTTNYGELCADFASATYDYASMSNTSGNAEVAELMYHCGVAVYMNYSPSGSGAYSSSVVNALKNFFDYKNVLLIRKSSYAEEDWNRILRNEIDNNRPFYYAGYGSSSGHAFVFDGYQGTNYFHINWGWGGSYNGYFYLDDLTPASFNFNSSQQAVIGTIPADDFVDMDGSSAVELFCATPVSANIANGTDYYNYYKITYPQAVGKELLYKVTTAYPGRIRIKITNNVGGSVYTFLLSEPHQDSVIAYGSNGLIVDNTNAGTYYIVVEGANGTQPTFDIEVICPTLDADLVVSEAQVSPMFIEASMSNVKFSSSIENIGNTDASSCEIEYYLSNDNVFDGSDLLLGSDVVPAINIGQKYNLTSTLTMPAWLTSGNYYVIFNVDRNNTVVETDDDNYAATYITVPEAGLLDCSSAIALQDNVWSYGNTQTDGVNNITQYNAAYDMTGPEVIYSFFAEYDGIAKVSLIEKSTGQLVGIVLPVCNENTYASSIWIPSIADTIGFSEFPVTAGTEYYVVIDGSKGAYGDYGVKVELPKQCPSLNITASRDILLCDGEAYPSLWTTYGFSDYQWYKDGEAIPDATESWYLVTNQGKYNVEATANGCVGSSDPLNIQMSFPPDTAIIAYTGDLDFCDGGGVELQLDNSVSYPINWQLNGELIPGATYPTYFAQEKGVYTLATINGSCYITSDNSIEVTPSDLPVDINQNLPLPSDDVLFYYTFKDGNNDLSGNNYLFSCWDFEPVNDRFGNFWEARNFTDADVFGYSAVYKELPDTFALSYWINTNTTEGGVISGFVNNPWNQASMDVMVYMSDNGKIHFYISNGGSPAELVTNQSYNDGNWHCVTVTHSGGISLDIDNGTEHLSNVSVLTNGTYKGYWIFAGSSLPATVSDAPTSNYINGSIDDIICVLGDNSLLDDYNYKLPKLSVELTSNQDNCLSATANFKIINSQPDVDYKIWNETNSQWYSSAVGGTMGDISIGGLSAITETSDFKIYATNKNTLCQTILDTTITVNVFDGSEPTLSINADQTDSICEGSNAVFNAIPTGEGSNPDYEWYLNSVLQAGNTAIYSAILAPGSYEIYGILNSSNTCASVDTAVSDTLKITVLEMLTPEIELTDNTSYPLYSGAEAQFATNVVNGGDNPVYQWYVNGLEVGDNSSVYNFNPQNNDEVYVKLTPDLKCSEYPYVNSDTAVIYVNTVGLNENGETYSLKVYPVPSTSMINIESDEKIKLLQIFDATGKLVYQESMDRNYFEMEISTWQSSIYTIRIITKDKVYTNTFIKK